MRKTANFFESICSLENLYHAWYKVSIGRSKKSSVLDFYHNLDSNLAIIAKELREGIYKPGPYNRFLIKDPKERVISAPAIRDRVVQHALLNKYDPVFDAHLIHDCYACRKNKGTKSAVLRAFHFSRAFRAAPPGYFLKLDVRKYFDSIDHHVLKDALIKIVKDKKALCLFYTIIDSNTGVPNKGLPIGNLTSQYFANHYLFFGFLIKPKGIYLQRKIKNRYKSRLKEINHALKYGLIDETEAGRRIESVTAHLLLARSRKFRNTVLNGRVLGD
jgi:retron-type reverse transcriptase